MVIVVVRSSVRLLLETGFYSAVSWGSPRCSAAERYSVFARVAKFRSWIDQNMGLTPTPSIGKSGIAQIRSSKFILLF